jgi:succinate dehydrogenase / fumarate reductase cytochrome b subunit
VSPRIQSAVADAVSPVPPTTTRGGHTPGRLRVLWRSSIGKKFVVAISGVILVLWLALHMVGNLKALGGPGDRHAAIDHYSHWLRTAGEPVLPRNGMLWITRLILLAAVAFHLVAITQLWLRNRRARPAGHAPARVRRTLAARTMYSTGPLLLAFIVFHILHFTLRAIHPTPLAEGHVYANLDHAFAKWWIVVIYLGAVGLLALHLWHALWGAAQTAGLDNPDRNVFFRRLAAVVTLVIAVGFALPPVLFFVGALPDAS